MKKTGMKDRGEWGLMAIINLYNCNPDKIKNPLGIKKFTVMLCDLIDMKRYGEAIIERFGKGDLEGYSMMQLIETSSVTAHFDEIGNRAFIDIFSCRSFEVKPAVNFCVDFFQAKNFKCKVIVRK